MSPKDKLQRLLGFAQYLLEGSDELIERNKVTHSDVEQFQKLVEAFAMFNYTLDGMTKKEARELVKQDLEEMLEMAGGSSGSES